MDQRLRSLVYVAATLSLLFFNFSSHPSFAQNAEPSIDDQLSSELQNAEGAASPSGSGPAATSDLMKLDETPAPETSAPTDTATAPAEEPTLDEPAVAPEETNPNADQAQPSPQEDVTPEEPAPADVVQSGNNPDAAEAPAEIANLPAGEEFVDERVAPKERMKICNCRFTADTPYSERRKWIGGYFGIQSGLYEPTNYQPDFSTQTFANYYGSSKTPIIEAAFGLKFNVGPGSIGPHVTAGYFAAKNDAQNAAMYVAPITAGALIALDNFFSEPLVVPYAIGGMYTALYNEKAGGLSVGGRTGFAGFYAVGLMLQLNWMDDDAAKQGYIDFGLENTFLYVEGRSFLASASPDPNLSTPLQLTAGLRLEF